MKPGGKSTGINLVPEIYDGVCVVIFIPIVLPLNIDLLFVHKMIPQLDSVLFKTPQTIATSWIVLGFLTLVLVNKRALKIQIGGFCYCLRELPRCSWL